MYPASDETFFTHLLLISQHNSFHHKTLEHYKHSKLQTERLIKTPKTNHLSARLYVAVAGTTQSNVGRETRQPYLRGYIALRKKIRQSEVTSVDVQSGSDKYKNKGSDI